MAGHILLIETGGTFGCEAQGNGIRALGGNSILDFAAVRERIAKETWRFSVKRPFTILSENMTIGRLEQWLDFLKTTDFSPYDGVIVTHGTDTLAYTVNLTVFALGKIDIPFIFTAADRPLTHAESNGIVNFLAALDLMKAKENGVFAVYRNEDRRIYVHRGGRLRQMDDIHSCFMSHLGIPFGEIIDGRFVYFEHFLNLRRQPTAKPYPQTTLSRGILRIIPYPGLDYGIFDLTGICAVLVETYHSATYCTAGERESLNFLLARLDKETPVFIVGGQSGEERYQSDLALRPNIIFADDVAPEAQYVKMLLAFGSGNQKAALAYLKENISGEKVSS